VVFVLSFNGEIWDFMKKQAKFLIFVYVRD
jgi:hypothetical protein